MNFYFEFQVSDAFLKAQFEAGKMIGKTQKIIVEFETLTKEERSLIAFFFTPSYNSVEKIYSTLEGNTIADVITNLKAKKEESEKQKQDAENKKQKEAADAKEKAQAFLRGEIDPPYYFEYKPSTGDTELDQRVKTRFAEVKAADVKAKAEKEAAEKKAVEKEKNQLCEWAKQNGSDHLKALIDEGFNWFEKAKSEWIEKNTPQGFDDISKRDDYNDLYELKSPSMNAINVLKKMKKLYPSARLVRVKFDGGDDYIHEDYVQIKIDVLGGGKYVVERFIETANID